MHNLSHGSDDIWNVALHPRYRGARWSDKEKDSFVIALEKFGKNLRKIQGFVATRTFNQVKRYYAHLMIAIRKDPKHELTRLLEYDKPLLLPWSNEENELLLAGIKANFNVRLIAD